jgi:hypothetical protein
MPHDLPSFWVPALQVQKNLIVSSSGFVSVTSGEVVACFAKAAAFPLASGLRMQGALHLQIGVPTWPMVPAGRGESGVGLKSGR